MPLDVGMGEIMLEIVPLAAQSAATQRRVAQLLLDAFAGWPGSWSTLAEADEEVAASLGEERFSLVALDEDGGPVGWIGAISSYDGRVWELHPLAVTPLPQRRGVGRKLVDRLEQEEAAAGGLTMYVGTDEVTELNEHRRPGPVSGRPDIMMAKRIGGPGGSPCRGARTSV